MAEPVRPELTFPEDEAKALADAYARASTILEYGSGGSTVLGAELGKAVFSVESDAEWLRGMQDWFEASPPKGRVVLHHGDIGPTGKWGAPVGPKSFRHFPGYALSVWDRPDFEHPDVVLVDGRFRPACLLTTAFRITRPVTVLVDDYAVRPQYHEIESFLKPVRLHGRMAEFDVAPTTIPADRLNWVIGWFLKAQ
ncbi:hypothetical protein ACSBLW_03990 [Thioclava sp. FR2]|uniref:hypothetical protein n=1 Tax=Thioclava sp. FR2 TaxID=3445780 RepID=UPI003EBE6444